MSTAVQQRKPLGTEDARRWACVGALAALAVVIGWVETFIPLPLPIAGVKLGLANIVVLVALVVMDARSAALVALIKVLAAGLLFGNPLMMLFSAAGTLLAFVVMTILIRVPGLHLAVVSVAAAMAHNIGQLAVAQVVLGTPLVWYSAPFMLLAACATGTLCGFAAVWTIDALDPREHDPQTPGRQDSRSHSPSVLLPARTQLPARSTSSATEGPSGSSAFSGIDIRIRLLALLAFFIVAFHVHNPLLLAALALVALAAALATRVNFARALRLLLPLAFVLALTVLMQLAYHQNGDVLLQAGPLTITSAGAWEALRMVVVQVSVVLASVAFMKSTNTTELLRCFAWLLRPLARLGLNVDGVVLSLTVAMAFIPVLAREFLTLRAAHASRGASFEGPVRERLAAHARLFAPLVRSSFRHAESLADSLLSRAF